MKLLKFIFCLIFLLNFIEGSFFACCSCPQPFQSSNCGGGGGYVQQQQQPAQIPSSYYPAAIPQQQQQQQQFFSGYQVAQHHETPIIIDDGSDQIPAPILVPYQGTYDPFEPVHIQEIYVPVLYRPRPRHIIYQPIIEIHEEVAPRQKHKPQKPKPKPKEEDACYVNDSGFKCCNTDLEKTMHGAYSALKRSPTFNECNIGLMTKVVQKASQKRFRLSFEVVVSLKMFGVQTKYDGNYTCRFERDGKHFMSYATPVQYDFEDAKSENTLSQTDLTHDEDDTSVTDQEKMGKIQTLNENLKDVKSTGKEIQERRLKRAAENNIPTFIENNCIIEFNKLNSTTSGNHGFVTHEITMGSLSSTTISQRQKRNNPKC